MRRTIVQPADVSDAPLSSLKTWLGITRDGEDELLQSLLLTSLEMCEAYTDHVPLSQLVEERMPAGCMRYDLASRPVVSLESVEVEIGGTRSSVSETDFEFQIMADQRAYLEISSQAEGETVIISVRTGLGQDWSEVPNAMAQGIIRLAAHYYRARDVAGAPTKDVLPPHDVKELWRPWRRIKFA